MLKPLTKTTQLNDEQLLHGFLTSLKMFVIAFSFLLLFIIVLVRAIVTLATAILACADVLCNFAIDRASAYNGTRDMMAFLATR